VAKTLKPISWSARAVNDRQTGVPSVSIDVKSKMRDMWA
jgi:hypothetical protein